MNRFCNLFLCLVLFLSSGFALMAGVVESPPSMPAPDFLHQVLSVVNSMGGLSTVGKISALITLLISSTKVGALNDLVWSRLGKSQAWVAPLLALIAGVAGLGAGGAAVTPALVFVYLVAGGGAVFLHELLDSLKGVPGFGTAYKGAISAIDTALGGAPKPVPVLAESQDKGASSR